MPPCSTGLGNLISRYTIPNFATLPTIPKTQFPLETGERMGYTDLNLTRKGG